MTKVLQIKNLTTGHNIGHKKEVLLHKIESASIGEGQLVSVLGLNGSGKTTLIKSLMGMIKTASGEVLLNGKPLKKMNAADMALNLSVVLTDKLDDSFLRAIEIVELGRFPHGRTLGVSDKNDDEIIESAFNTLNISLLKNRIFANLSDGEKQRVLIARALVQDTPLILLDEPAAFIDSPGRLSIMKMLRRICDIEKKSILMTSHDIETALQFSDRAWLLSKNGNFVSGTPQEIIDKGLVNKFFDDEEVEFNRRNLKFEIK